MDLGLLDNLLDARPDVEIPAKQTEEVRRGELAEAALPWFEAFYARMREEYLKELADASRENAYELAVKTRVLEEMRLEIRKDASRLNSWKQVARMSMEE